jgi:cyclase
MRWFFLTLPQAHRAGQQLVNVIEQTASHCFMPLTVGGGIRTVEDMNLMLKAGADKVSINTAAIANPDLIRAGAEKFGSQCIVVSMDVKKVSPNKWCVFSYGGRKQTDLDAIEWAKKAVSLGAGEICFKTA